MFLIIENIEWIFNEDVRDKKRTGNGIHGRAARLRKHEAVIMPSDRIRGRFERKSIFGAAPCFTTTLREMIFLKMIERVKEGEFPTKDELLALPFEDGQKVFAELRRLYTTKSLYTGLESKPSEVSDLSWHFKVARAGRQVFVGDKAIEILQRFTDNVRNQVENKTNKGSRNKNKNKEENKNPEELTPTNVSLVEIKKPEIEPTRISLKNIYSAEQLIAMLMRMQQFIEGQENSFEVSLVIQEKLK